MNKLTKIGLTALAGSLATVAGAQAGALSVNGGADISWTSTTGNATAGAQTLTGNPYGFKNNLTFVGAGELDNGWTWTANAYNTDAQSLTSSNISFDMGGIGSLLVDSGAGGAGLDALDDKMPTAFEESWDAAISSGVQLVSGVHGSLSFTYTTPADSLPYGTKVRLAWAPKADGGGLQADKGNSGAAHAAKGQGRDITIEMSPMDGLNLYAGYSEIENLGNNSTNSSAACGAACDDDLLQGIYGGTLSMGPVTLGYAQAYISHDTGGTLTNTYYDNTTWGIAFNVNDNLSVSYNELESEEHIGAASGGQTLAIDSLHGSYTMGAASLKLMQTEASEVDYVANNEHDTTAVVLGLSF